ncbi:uncharacterized protein LOC125679921 isoform X2 [Ostrea edulis]|uniref:uncharacterized protein LOC125679921 isoform X2 n=1 Tax=Ostrea edulis TaxID=37623 RepID=UPI0024AE8B65|nr:uncharacterized protein LOC125679921 isoform X2 [Ostrea edulis]
MSEYEPKYVVVNMVEEAEKLVTKFEIDTVTKFTIFSRNKGFSHDLDCLQGHRVLWEDKGQEEGVKVPCNGTPFIILGFDVRECHFGPDRNTMKKKKYQMEKTIEADQDHSYTQKSRTLVQNTKKLDCPARIYMKKICKFPDYKILGHDSIWKRKKQVQKLKKALSTNEDMLREEEIHIFFPGIESHKNHLTGQRWVWLFRKNLFNIRVSTTNGLERQHLKLKQDYLSQTSDKSLSSLVNVLFSQVFPDSYNRYIDYNARSLESIKAYASIVPRFLKNRPRLRCW